LQQGYGEAKKQAAAIHYSTGWPFTTENKLSSIIHFLARKTLGQ
jgi:hypothetical protein